jgi:hypothetical protein
MGFEKQKLDLGIHGRLAWGWPQSPWRLQSRSKMLPIDFLTPNPNF